MYICAENITPSYYGTVLRCEPAPKNNNNKNTFYIRHTRLLICVCIIYMYKSINEHVVTVLVFRGRIWYFTRGKPHHH